LVRAIRHRLGLLAVGGRLAPFHIRQIYRVNSSYNGLLVTTDDTAKHVSAMFFPLHTGLLHYWRGLTVCIANGLLRTCYFCDPTWYAYSQLCVHLLGEARKCSWSWLIHIFTYVEVYEALFSVIYLYSGWSKTALF